MICSLNETQLSDLRKITYKKLSGLKPSESFDLEGFIKDIYNRIKKAAGEEKALQYAQIIPLTIHYVQADDEINSILAKTDFNPTVIMKLRAEFNDIDNVKKYVTKSVRKKSKKELKDELEHENFQLDNLEITDPDDSVLEKMQKAKIEFPNVTSFQFGDQKNPEAKDTQEEDVTSEDKKVFEVVLKLIYRFTFTIITSK